MKSHVVSRLALFVCLALQPVALLAQQYIYVSREGIRKVLRVNIGLTQWSIRQTDSSARKASGIHLSNEVKIISGFMKKENSLAIYDAFYFDIDLGTMRNDPRTVSWSSGPEKESRFSVCTNFGYLALAGYRNTKWGSLAGIDFRWRQASVGGTAMPNLYGPLFYFNAPIVARGEYCISREVSDKRIIATFWYGSGKGRLATYKSVRIEFPLGSRGRWWLLGQYIRQSALAQDNFMTAEPRNALYNQWTLGIRVGNLP